MWSVRKTAKTKGITFLSDIKKISAKSDKRKVIEIIKKAVSEQADKKSVESHEQVFM